MKNKKLILLCFLLVITLLASACNGKAKGDVGTNVEPESEEVGIEDSESGEVGQEVKVDGGTMIYPVAGDVSSLNLWYETGDEGMTILKPVYDPLYIIDKGETRYYLAESHEVSEDNMKVKVKLKENLKWHDGVDITAEDLIFNFYIKSNPDNGSTSGTIINRQPVAYEKLDNYTVEFTLPEVSASYIAALGNIKMIPKHIYEGEENIKSSDKNNIGIGSGPYKVVEWKKGEEVILERFEDYYRGVPNIENLVFKIIPEESVQEIALQSGEISMMRVTNSDKYEKYNKDEKYNLWTFSEGRNNYLGFNSNSEIMKDIKVRLAITKALDCDEIIAGAYGEGMAVRGQTILNPSNFFYDESVKGYEHDLEEAEKLIEETGLAGKTLKLVYNSSRVNMENTALVIQQQLKRVGIEVEVTGYETQGFFEKFFYSDAGDWDIGLNGYSTNADPDGNGYMFKKDGFLTGNVFTSDEANELWIAGNNTTDDGERSEIYSKLQEQIRDDYVMYPISMSNFTLVANKNFRGLDELSIVPVFEDYMRIYMVE